MKTLASRSRQDSLRALPAEEDYALCSDCGCSWFEEVRVARVDKERMIILGMAPMKLSEVFVLVRCIKCGELHEPNIMTTTNPAAKLYRQLVSELSLSKPDKLLADKEEKENKKKSE